MINSLVKKFKRKLLKPLWKRLTLHWAFGTSHKRDLFVKEWITAHPQGSSILDAGAGIQRYKKFANHLSYTSQDFGKYEGGDYFGEVLNKEWDSKKCDIISDITSIPKPDNYFDYILCTEVFEHIVDPIKAFEELSRLLKKGGRMLITAPFRSTYHQEPYFFYTGFSRYWFEHFSSEFNLKIIEIVPNGNYFKDLSQEIIRITTFGSDLRRILTIFFTLPYLIYIYFLDKYTSIKTPKSCDGYFVILEKK